MSDFQSIAREYRNSDVLTSGFPIPENPTLSRMRKIERSPFGQRVYDRRTALGMTQTKLGELAQIAQSTIAEMEKTGKGSAATSLLAKALQCSAEWLATGEGSMRELEAWPFDTFTPVQFYRLTEDFRRDIEDKILGQIVRMEKTSGEPPPERPRRTGTDG